MIALTHWQLATIGFPDNGDDKVATKIGDGMGHFLKAVTFSIKASKRARKPILVRFDGEDWIHTWSDGAMVSPKPSKRPIFECTTSLPLFTFRYLPSAGDVVFDVGAGIGTELQAFAEMVGAQGHVYALEADPTALRCLRKLCARLNLENVTIVDTALGNREGVTNFLQEEGGSIDNRIHASADRNTMCVPITRMDTLVERLAITRIDYLKMNIEGAEVDALMGFEQHYRMVRNWCVSCHDFLGRAEVATFADVKKWMSERGYSPTSHPHVPGEPWKQYYLFN